MNHRGKKNFAEFRGACCKNIYYNEQEGLVKRRRCILDLEKGERDKNIK